MAKLLDVVEDHELLGSNMWADDDDEYRTWALGVGYPERDLDMFKQKFDRQSNENKNTGNPSLPPNV